MQNKTEKKKPAISVLVPVYNGEKYIETCLDSLLRQTWTDYEIVIDIPTVALIEGYYSPHSKRKEPKNKRKTIKPKGKSSSHLEYRTEKERVRR